MTSDLRAQLQAALGGAYVIERELGGGGMSRVFLATETGLTRSVVVKILTPELAAEVSAERFAREVKLAARLQQANIVPLLNAGQANGLPWYSMPYVRGESLRAKLASGAPVPVTDVVHILRDVARALAFAHGEGVAHRDIKPENILISGGAAVVTDFGIAKALTTSRTQDGGDGSPTITQMGASIGTPAYMAPEQVAGDPNVDHRADIYSWGVVAWELLGGKHPFTGKTNAQGMLAAHLSETAAALTSIRSEVPPALSVLVSRCLEKDPANRPQSANELLTALDQIGSTSGSAPAMATPSRHWGRALAIAAAIVVVVATGAWLTTRKSAGPGSSTGYKSLAVLPFASLGGDTANAYFAEGMADELTTELAKVTGLRLAATSSAAAYRNKTADVREVGKSLSVAAVLQGAVRREGGRIRVSAQLSDAADGLVVWTNSYEREVKDVFAVQDELTRDIVGALRVRLAGNVVSGGAAPTRDTTDFETYDVYLRGLHFLRLRGKSVLGSIGYFRQALARDSTYGRAWSELGEAYCVLPLYAQVPVDSALPFGRAAIARAHALDPSDANAYAAEGFCDMLAIQPREAEAAFARALSLDSGNVLANRAHWSALESAGHTDAAVDAARRTARFDPLDATSAWVGGQVMLVAKRYDEGIAMAKRSVELDSSAGNPARLVHALILHATGNDSGARTLLRASSVSAPQIMPWLGYLTAVTGDRTGVIAFVRQRESQRGHDSFTNLTQAWTYLGGGDTTQALDALERAERAREPLPFSVPFSMPAYDPLRHSARFAAVIKGYGMEPADFGVRDTAPR
jgi:serine/threonine-protein kinase